MSCTSLTEMHVFRSQGVLYKFNSNARFPFSGCPVAVLIVMHVFPSQGVLYKFNSSARFPFSVCPVQVGLIYSNARFPFSSCSWVSCVQV